MTSSRVTAAAASKPRVRALIVDARAERRRSLIAHFIDRGLARSARLPLTARIESEQLDVLFEEHDVHAGLEQRVAHGRGVDVAVVIAGNGTGRAAAELRALQVCGVRRAVTLVEPGGPSALEENLGRHLLLGADLDADAMPAVTLGHAAHEMDDDDVAALLAAVDASVPPRVDEGFALGTVADRGTFSVTTRLLRGSLHEAQARGFLVTGVRDVVGVSFACTRGRAGDVVVIELDGDDTIARDFALASERFDLASDFRVDLEPALVDGEMLVAFGGAYGFSNARARDGVVECSAPLALVDDRIGLVRTRGYAQVLSAHATKA